MGCLKLHSEENHAPMRVVYRNGKRVGTPFPDDIADAITYNLENQIGSSVARLDTNGTIIDREEYYPFGDSSFRTFTKKRYRYVGKEKDLESGLYYYGARYYAAWVGRFISVDPLSAKYAQLSPYNYADNNPINDYDIDGMQNNNTEGSQQSGPVKNPLPVAKDASGNTITNQETGEAIRPSVNAVEVHYTEPKDPMQFVSTLSPLPDLKNPYKAANIVPVIKGNFDVAPPAPQQFYFEKSASQETQDYWAQQHKIRELSSGPMRQFMIGGKSLEIGYEIASTVEGVGAIKNLGKFAFKKAFSFGGAAKGGMTELQLVTKAAQKAEAAIGGSGGVAGTLKHTYAKKLLSRYQSMYGGNLSLGSNYFNGPAGRGFLDAVNHSTKTIYDFKFGNAFMSNSQFLKYSNSFPGYGIQIIKP